MEGMNPFLFYKAYILTIEIPSFLRPIACAPCKFSSGAMIQHQNELMAIMGVGFPIKRRMLSISEINMFLLNANKEIF